MKSFQFSFWAPAWVEVEKREAVLAGWRPSTSFECVEDETMIDENRVWHIKHLSHTLSNEPS